MMMALLKCAFCVFVMEKFTKQKLFLHFHVYAEGQCEHARMESDDGMSEKSH